MKKNKTISAVLIVIMLLSVTVGIKMFYMPEFHANAIAFYDRQIMLTNRLMALTSKFGDFIWVCQFDSDMTGEAIGPGFGVSWLVCIILKTITGFAGVLTWAILVPAACICGICGAMQNSERAKKYAIRMTVLAIMFFVVVPLMAVMLRQIGQMDFTTDYRVAIKYVIGDHKITANDITTTAKYEEVIRNCTYYMGYLLMTRLVLVVAVLSVVSTLLRKLLTRLIIKPAAVQADTQAQLSGDAETKSQADTQADAQIQEGSSNVSNAADTSDAFDGSVANHVSADKTEESKTQTSIDATEESKTQTSIDATEEAKTQKSLGKTVLRKLWTLTKEIIGFILILYICKYLLMQIAEFYGIQNEIFDNLVVGLENIKPALQEIFHGLQ